MANAPRQSTAPLWAKTEQPDLYGRSTTKKPDLYGRSTTKADLRAVGRSYPVKARGPRGAKRLVGERNREHAPGGLPIPRPCYPIGGKPRICAELRQGNSRRHLEPYCQSVLRGRFGSVEHRLTPTCWPDWPPTSTVVSLRVPPAQCLIPPGGQMPGTVLAGDPS